MSDPKTWYKAKRRKKSNVTAQQKYLKSQSNLKRADDFMWGLVLGFLFITFFTLSFYTGSAWILLLALFAGLGTLFKLGD